MHDTNCFAIFYGRDYEDTGASDARTHGGFVSGSDLDEEYHVDWIHPRSRIGIVLLPESCFVELVNPAFDVGTDHKRPTGPTNWHLNAEAVMRLRFLSVVRGWRIIPLRERVVGYYSSCFFSCLIFHSYYFFKLSGSGRPSSKRCISISVAYFQSE